MSPNPVATYRLQLHKGFGFHDAALVADHLAELGISHLYLSPILHSRAGSQHGYDVIDPQRVDEELGGLAGLRALRGAWPGQIIVDIVPNHMAVTDPGNRWWWDVLKHGPGSEFAGFFDIDWDPSEERLKRSILIPILGDHYGRVLEAGGLKLEIYDGEPCVRCFEHVLPLAPSSRPHDLETLNRNVDLIHEVLEAQHYRLAHWKVAGQELNYRRFFAINDLAALRMDRAEVFEATHRTIIDLVKEGLIDCLRVDHIDGLRYPREYLQQLQEAVGDRHVVVEKILEGDEELPNDWPVAGTTGYEFIGQVDGLFVDPGAEKPLSDLFDRFTGAKVEWHETAIAAKLQVMDTELSADIERSTELFVKVCEDQRRYRDFTRPELRQALRETIASFDVYRTYTDARDPVVRSEDALVIERATDDACSRRPDLDPELFGLLRDVLLLNIEGEDEAALAMRFQQVSGPVMAKGIEDTSFYRFNRFVALNEVGGSPEHFGRSADDLHRFNARIQTQWPLTMLAGSTHDTKRSEDIRGRLAVLSEIPDEWGAAVTRWSQHNENHRQSEWPDRATEYLLYQTLVGAWPLSVERAATYMDKAAKEAKVNTSWISPNEHHDAALRGFIESIMADRAFMDDVAAFVAPLVEPGYVNSLAQLLLRMTSPGVPDFYQGTELWDFSLVDPDNRRPVDYDIRRRLLDEVRHVDAATAWARAAFGAPRSFLIQRTLAVRTRQADAFGPDGSYTPLTAVGTRSAHVVAFARGSGAVTIVPRLALTVGRDWGDTKLGLPEGRWVSVLTDDRAQGEVRMDQVFENFPVALFERTD